jgi:hypothetical protein
MLRGQGSRNSSTANVNCQRIRAASIPLKPHLGHALEQLNTGAANQA